MRIQDSKRYNVQLRTNEPCGRYGFIDQSAHQVRELQANVENGLGWIRVPSANPDKSTMVLANAVTSIHIEERPE